MDPLIDRREYAALAEGTYLNQASLGLIPRSSLAARVRFLNDVAQLAAAARRAGARTVIDVTQMAGAAPVSMTGWGADALVCSGYKWLSAPGGAALLAVTADIAAAIPPVIGWKGSAAPFDFRPHELSLATGARRFELSTMSYSAAAGLFTSIGLLTGVGLASIREHACRLAAALVEQVA